MDRRPTIVDVATRAGVSKSTVSLVLQNSPSVRPETRRKVTRAMADLGYVYNRAAANLRSSGAGLIGLVINDLRNPFFAEFATSVQMALSSQGYAAVVANTAEDPALQAQVVSAMIEHGISACVISPAYGGGGDGGGDGGFAALARAGIPAIQVLRKVDPRTDLFPFAAPDYPKGSRIATEHLATGGTGRIAFVGGVPGRGVSQERMAGYLDVLGELGAEPLVLAGPTTRSFGRGAAQTLARQYPDVDAALCFNDLVALGLMTGCAEIGRKIGAGGLRIVGFDDIEECAQFWPPLSSVGCDIAGFGASIAVTILSSLKGVAPPAETRTAVTLAIRASSALHAPRTGPHP